MAYYDALIAKWATLTPGTTQQKLDQINTITVASSNSSPMIIPTYKIYNLIDVTEFQSLNANNQQLVRDIIGMGTVDASPGTSIRARMTALFGAGTATRIALTALAATYDSPQIPWWQASVADGGGALRSPVTQNDLTSAGGLS